VKVEQENYYFNLFFPEPDTEEEFSDNELCELWVTVPDENRSTATDDARAIAALVSELRQWDCPLGRILHILDACVSNSQSVAGLALRVLERYGVKG